MRLRTELRDLARRLPPEESHTRAPELYRPWPDDPEEQTAYVLAVLRAGAEGRLNDAEKGALRPFAVRVATILARQQPEGRT